MTTVPSMHVDHAACIAAYYDHQLRVTPSSIHPPESAYVKERDESKRKRKRPTQTHLTALEASAKFIPLDPTIIALLAQAHQTFLNKQTTKYSVSTHRSPLCWTEFPFESIASDRLYANNSKTAIATAAVDGTRAFLPPQSSFALTNVLRLKQLTFPHKFRFVLMDPPWSNQSVRRSHRYKTFQHTDLFQINLPALCDPELCVLAIWVTNKPLYRQFLLENVLPQWGFSYHDTWFWLKICANGDLVTPLNSTHKLPFEQLVVAYHAADETQKQRLQSALGDRVRVVLSVPLRHSWKPPPECFFDDSAWKLCATKLELFARELRPSWTSVGNEVLKFQTPEFLSSANTTDKQPNQE